MSASVFTFKHFVNEKTLLAKLLMLCTRTIS